MLQHSDRTFYHVLGNHDLYAQTRREVLSLTGQARYHAITTDRAVLAFIDTAREMDYEDWGGWIDEEQLHWLEAIVRSSGTKPLLVFAHHPVYDTTTRSNEDKGSIHPGIDMWRILSQKQGTGIYFNGHTHVDSIVTQNNWTFVQVSACLDQHAVRIVDIEQEEIRISAVDIPDAVLTDNVQTLYKSMQHFTHNPEARGQDADRECNVPLVLATEQK